MKFSDLTQIVGENLIAHRLRAFLTIIGITIGIAAVIAVVAVGQGGQAVILDQIESMGSSRYFEISVDYAQGEAPTANSYSLEDINLIKSLSPAVSKMAPLTVGTMIDVRIPGTGQKPAISTIYGTTPDYLAAINHPVQAGRFISSLDVTAHARVAVIDATMAEKLFPHSDPLGKQIFVKDSPVTVVGVMKKQSSALGSMFTMNTAYLPITFAQDLLNTQVINSLCGVASSNDTVQQAIDDSLTILKKRHASNNTHYIGQSLEDQLQSVSKVTSILTTVIGAVAAIALVVGGVGVMNIMLVAVSERTREIGLLKALGAKRRDIMQQFLAEAVALCLVGGALGILLGAGCALLVARFAHWPPLISVWTVLLAFGFSALVGLFFGLYPANRAAALSPAEALRQL